MPTGIGNSSFMLSLRLHKTVFVFFINTLLFSWCNSFAFAQEELNVSDSNETFEKNGICYRTLNQSEVEVVMSPSTAYSGTLKIPASIKYNGKNYVVSAIGDYAFSGCDSLKEINLPHSVRQFGEGAFWKTPQLKKINIDKGKTRLFTENGILYKGTTLITAYNPDLNCVVKAGTSTIASYALCGNNNELLSVVLPESVDTILASAFQEQTSLDTIILSDNVKFIGDRAFQGCSLLRNIRIPDQVRHIGYFCFYDCTGLRTVQLGKNVEEIGEGVFYDCISLRTIYCHCPTPPSMLHIENGVFYFSNESETIEVYIPKNSETKYRNSCDWKEFHLTFSSTIK